MTDRSAETILLIGDAAGGVRAAIASVLPGATMVAAESVFDGIAVLANAALPAATRFTTVLAAAEPIERRPEAAVRALRDLAGGGRLVLFGHSTLELLSRKMTRFGCDDYLVTPASGDAVRQVFSAPGGRLASPRPVTAVAERAEPATLPPPRSEPSSDDRATHDPAPSHAVPSSQDDSTAESVDSGATASLDATDVGGILLDALLQHPHDPVTWALEQVNAGLASAVELSYGLPGSEVPAPTDGGSEVLTLPIPTAGTLRATVRNQADGPAALAILNRLAPLVAKAVTLQARHASLQKMAITDELTGLYNARYFRHFLQRILDKARQMHFPVTLLMFEIDDFKGYNDRFGHQVGDEILKQTAAMMKKCTREHDLVARIGGDEFAVVFWDKEGPRQPRQPRSGNVSRPPQSPVQVFERFKRMIQSARFTALGEHGQGKLGISAGLAVYPYEGHDVETLVAEADRALMQGSKKHGKNRLSLVGNGGNGTGFGTNGNGVPR
ncbi:MAG: hypothetical protein JWO31_3316 [Phycisphaerales bacterium]|nr:hypothetical protein [Phycisphaerales bacterium]